MTPDPGNAGAVPGNPQSWNMYSYVVNNPETLTDPSGRTWVCGPTTNATVPGGPVTVSANCKNTPDDLWVDVGVPTLLGLNPDGSLTGLTGLGNLAPLPLWPRYAPFSQAPQTTACKTGFGFGVEGGGDASLGIGYTGAAATGSGGAGLFFEGSQWVSAGAYASGGATAYAGPHVAGAPAQTAGSPLAVGGGVGAGGGVFFTNASSASQLSGPFLTLAGGASFGMVGLSVQISEGKDAAGNTIWELSASYTPGFGLYGYGLTTSAKAAATGAPCQ